MFQRDNNIREEETTYYQLAYSVTGSTISANIKAHENIVSQKADNQIKRLA